MIFKTGMAAAGPMKGHDIGEGGGGAVGDIL